MRPPGADSPSQRGESSGQAPSRTRLSFPAALGAVHSPGAGEHAETRLGVQPQPRSPGVGQPAHEGTRGQFLEKPILDPLVQQLARSRF